MPKKLRFLLLALVLTCLTWLIPLADIAIPELNNPVVDTVNLLSAEEKATLNQYLYDFYKKNGSQIVILIVSTTDSENIFDYSSRVFDKWKIGREKYDDGILITVVLKDRQVGIYPGSGLEGAVPDVIAKKIIDYTIKPYFKKGDYFSGLFNASQILEKLILGEEFPEYVESENVSHFDSIISFILLLLFLQYILFFFREGFGKVFTSILSGGFSLGLAESFGFSFWIVMVVMVLSVMITYFGLISIITNGFGGGNGGGSSSGYDNFGGVFGSGGFSGGGFGSGGSGGGGFGGGGGGFSGGGASGSW